MAFKSPDMTYVGHGGQEAYTKNPAGHGVGRGCRVGGRAFAAGILAETKSALRHTLL